MTAKVLPGPPVVQPSVARVLPASSWIRYAVYTKTLTMAPLSTQCRCHQQAEEVGKPVQRAQG